MNEQTRQTDRIVAPALSGLAGIRHGFFTRQGGVSSGIYESLNTGRGSDDDMAAVAANRSRACAALGVSLDALATPYQIHSADAVIADQAWPQGAGPKADAVVTDRPGIAVGIGTADCGPILFAEAEARIVGAAHAGWKGAFTGIIEATLEAMIKLGGRRERITAVLGPSISRRSYEVGPEFVERFEKADPDNAAFFAPSERPGHAFFDLPAYILARLKQASVGKAISLDRCTYEEEDLFYSYRRATHRNEPDYGRLLSAIVIEGN
ncbi:MAG TPA: peptidoglycan editing factor PgeF [Afifellaceae bacterium]|nr:peptidoglycan editing factor PgeF [Afifellaceae bacterium]